MIDKKTIRNRSHAIEQLIIQSLQPSVSTAVILAGGKKDTARETLRPLTVINDKPLIQHTLEHLAKHGVQKVYIATSSRGSAIKDVVGNGSQWGVKVSYVFEEEPLGTAGALQAIQHKLKTPFVVWAGDVLSDINLSEMMAFHQENEALATIAAKPRPTQQSYDNVFMQGHRIVDFQASKKDQQVSIVNASVYIFDPQVLSLIPDKTPVSLEKEVFPKLTAAKDCVAFVFQGMWFDVDTDQNYKHAFTGE